MTLIEVMVALTITLVALGMLSATLASTARTRAVNGEYTRAARATANLLERMNEEDFFELWARYNAVPGDDPDGPGTAPGAVFDVLGLNPQAGMAAVGSIRFPALFSEDSGDLELREDLEDRSLGSPRDLSADGKTDSADHAADYVILPLQIEVRWSGKGGNCSYSVYSMLSEMRL